VTTLTYLMMDPMKALVDRIAGELVQARVVDGTARIVTPLLFPSGSMIMIEVSRLRDGYLVTDGGVARREASLWGAERAFARLAPKVAERFGVRFDHNMLFDMNVNDTDVVGAVIAVANAAKTAVEYTAEQLATVGHADELASILDRLERVFGKSLDRKPAEVRGSTSLWKFDAVLHHPDHLVVFDVVGAHHVAVTSAVTKFLDVQDLGEAAPGRVAILTNRAKTPHLPILGRTARLISSDASDEAFLQAA
jgi:hypothetical protein